MATVCFVTLMCSLVLGSFAAQLVVPMESRTSQEVGRRSYPPSRTDPSDLDGDWGELETELLAAIAEEVSKNAYWDSLVRDLAGKYGGCSKATLSCRLCVPKPNVCLVVQYLKKEIGLKVSITYKGKTKASKQVVLTKFSPPAICFPLGVVCVKFYDVNIRKKSFCVKVKAVHIIGISLGCYTIPLSDEEMGEKYIALIAKTSGGSQPALASGDVEADDIVQPAYESDSLDEVAAMRELVKELLRAYLQQTMED